MATSRASGTDLSPTDERPLPVLRAMLAATSLAGRGRSPRASSPAERRTADERSPLSMPYVTRSGRGPLVVEDHEVARTSPEPVEGHVRLRSYRPPADDPLPALVFVHGGAYWLGSVEAYAPLCAWYAREVGCQVFSVDYRLAPEHPYPAGLDDCYAALRWVAEHASDLGVDLSRLAVGGVSAGGGLAAAVALLARDRSGPRLRAQLLEVPMLDPSMGSASLGTYGVGFSLTRADVETGWRHYLPLGVPAEHPGYAGAALAEDLAGLPPAVVLTAGCDPLRDEGETYAARLRVAGVPVTAHRAHGHVHGSHYLTRVLPSARASVAWTTEALRRALGGPGG